MMADYAAVKQLLIDLQNSHKVKFVSEDIQKHSQDPRFIHLLQIAIRDQQLPLNTQIAGAVVLSKVLNQMYFKMDDEMLAQILMGIITDMRVEHRIKQTIEVNLTTILQISDQKLFTKFVLKAAELLIMVRQQQTYMESGHQQELVEHVKSATLILRCLLNSNAHFPVLVKAIQQEFLDSTITSIKGFTVKQIDALIGLAGFWKSVLEKSRNGPTNLHSDILRQLSRSQNLTQWVFFLYQHDHLQGQPCFINLQPSQDSEHIKELKVAAANLHKQILLGLKTTSATNEEITKRHLSQIPWIFNTVCIFGTFKATCEVYQSFITELIGVIFFLVKTFTKEFEQSFQKILQIVAFPLLSITEEEQRLFTDEPEQFSSLAEDCCDKQTFGILKTEAARLLESICDDIDDAATFSIQHAIISLQVRLRHETTVNEIPENYLTVEQALTVLTVLSYKIGKNSTELNEMRTIFIIQDIKSKINPLDLTRIFQFLAYNYQDVYPFSSLGQNWVNLALKVSIEEIQRYPSLAYSALDFISNVFQNCFIQNVAMRYIQQINYSINYEIRFKILQKIIAKYYMNFTEQGLSLALKKLLEVVLVDVENYQKNLKAHTMDISHSLQTCRRIVQKGQMVKKGSSVRARIWEFVSYLQLFQKISLDDQVIKIIISFVKTEGISPQIHQITHKLLQIFKREYSQTSYIIFMNEIMLRVDDPVTCGLFYPLLEGATHLHSNILQHPTSVTDNLALATTLIALQNVVLMHGLRISAQVLSQVAENAMLIIPISDQPEDKTQGIIIARALNLLFICNIFKRDQRALRKMVQFSDAYLFKNHDLSVLALCMTRELFTQTDVVTITQMIIVLVDAIWKARQQLPQSKPTKKNPKIPVKSTVVKIHRIANYEACLKVMTKPFADSIIPQLQLRQALNKMKTINYCVYQSILASLPSRITTQLRQLISQVKIEGRRRKIVKTGNDKLSSDNKVNVRVNAKRMFSQSEEEPEQMNQDQENSFRKGLLKKKRKQEEKFSSKL